MPASGQRYVAPCTRWMATVDEATQQIVLQWSPSTDTLAAGYHICTGDTCRQYALLYNRFDTTYVCTNHNPAIRHLYRLHVFDTAGNTSTLTPPFGNMVLHATMDECRSAIGAEWSPCTGLYSGVAGYSLYARFVPFDTDHRLIYTADSTGPLNYSFQMPEGAWRAELKVCATGNDSALRAWSNVAVVERPATDTVRPPAIDSLILDSATRTVTVWLDWERPASDGTASLWRSINGGQWLRTGTVSPGQRAFADLTLQPYSDTLLCYRTAWDDPCGNSVNPTAEVCLALASPPQPKIETANTLLMSDEANNRWLPHIEGVVGETYELTIYDRHGLRIFHTTAPTEAWQPAPSTPQGVYTYALRVKFADGSIQNLAGTILLIK